MGQPHLVYLKIVYPYRLYAKLSMMERKMVEVETLGKQGL